LTRIINQAAIKLIQNTIKLPIYFAVGFWLTTVIAISFNPRNIIIGALVAFIIFLAHCLFDLTVSTLSFWMDDTWTLGLLKQIGLMIFGGLAYPLNLVPEKWKLIYNLLPFDLFVYLPTSLMMGTLKTSDIWWYVYKIVVWAILLLGIHHILWKRGLKTYCAYGQ
jgi:ABC-2 type transport system permease protein